MSEPIRVDGLREFVRNLKAMDNDLAKAVRVANNKAADIVVSDAVPRIPVGPGRGGHARSSVKARSTQTQARVTGGGKKYPYYPWLDFGGRVGRARSVKRPFMKTGRYIWKSFDDRSGDVYDTLVEALIDVARSADIEVNR